MLARFIITVTPRRRVLQIFKLEMRIEQTLEENRSHQSQGMLRGIRDCMVLTEYSACTISRIHLFDDKFPTVGVHNLTNALGLRLAESGSKLLIVNAFKQLTLSLYAY